MPRAGPADIDQYGNHDDSMWQSYLFIVAVRRCEKPAIRARYIQSWTIVRKGLAIVHPVSLALMDPMRKECDKYIKQTNVSRRSQEWNRSLSSGDRIFTIVAQVLLFSQQYRGTTAWDAKLMCVNNIPRLEKVRLSIQWLPVVPSWNTVHCRKRRPLNSVPFTLVPFFSRTLRTTRWVLNSSRKRLFHFSTKVNFYLVMNKVDRNKLQIHYKWYSIDQAKQVSGFFLL